MLGLEGKSALVTGGSRGIGRATSLLLGRLGASVAVNYVRNEAAARETAASVQRRGGCAVALQADVSIPAEAERLVASTTESFGALDILVVSHGIWKRADIHTMTPGEWDETLRVNPRRSPPRWPSWFPTSRRSSTARCCASTVAP